jgi:hypothetical protein
MQLRNIKSHKTMQILKASQMRFLRKLLIIARLHIERDDDVMMKETF